MAKRQLLWNERTLMETTPQWSYTASLAKALEIFIRIPCFHIPQVSNQWLLLTTPVHPSTGSGQALDHSNNPIFPFKNKYLQEYPGFAGLVQNRQKILVPAPSLPRGRSCSSCIPRYRTRGLEPPNSVVLRRLNSYGA
jgi:hypothetical protein